MRERRERQKRAESKEQRERECGARREKLIITTANKLSAKILY